MDALRLIVQALRLSARAAEKQLGISGAQLFVLQRLAEHGPQSIGDLAERTFTHQSSVSVLVSRLVARRLVVRHTAKQDRRRSEVGLTAGGRALIRRAPAAAQARMIEALRRLRPSECRELARALARLVGEMGIEQRLPPPFFEDEARAGKRAPRRRAPA